MERKARKSSPKRRSQIAAASIAAGVAGLLLAAWLVYGTASIDPFRWGLFVEELVVALCALAALRLLCVVRLPNWTALVCISLLPAGIALYGLLADAGDGALLGRALCLAAAGVFALLTARQMDTRPDGVLLAALLFAACVPVLISAGTRPIDELMRALIMAGMFMSVLAARQKSVSLAYLASVAFALAGAGGLYAAFAGAGAGIGALLLAPKRTRGNWTLAAVLMAALPVAGWFAAGALLSKSAPLFLQNALSAGAFALLVRTHLLRALALGLLLMATRFFFSREDAAAPVILALAGCACARLLPFVSAPDVWMDALPLCALAGVGVAKTARGKGR
ncbi:MAG: hypothetical protein GX417_08750 [Clostridiales bacterium]|nr:hypothetical protein [Clostridiales bacterium]